MPKALKILAAAASLFSLGGVSRPKGEDKPLDVQTLLERTGWKLQRDYPTFWN